MVFIDVNIQLNSKLARKSAARKHDHIWSVGQGKKPPETKNLVVF